jgi:hypothetical protein
MKEDERITNLSREALNRLGREGCVVIIVDKDMTHLNEGDGVRVVPNWGVRATDKNNLSARINFETLPEESDDQITEKLIDLFSQAIWK